MRLGRRVVADTTAALTLHEASYPPVYYIPRTDIDETQLTASSAHTYCPYKGEADYHGLTGPDGEITDAVWTWRGMLGMKAGRQDPIGEPEVSKFPLYDTSGMIRVKLAADAQFNLSFQHLPSAEALELARRFDWKAIQAALPQP